MLCRIVAGTVHDISALHLDDETSTLKIRLLEHHFEAYSTVQQMIMPRTDTHSDLEVVQAFPLPRSTSQQHI